LDHGLQSNLFAASLGGFGSRGSFHRPGQPAAAVRFGNALIDRVAILEKFPLPGTPYSKRPSVRKLVFRPCIIFCRFREKENYVDILRYWHSAQREPNLPPLD
jgi:plasmid stabilization system protein ParE